MRVVGAAVKPTDEVGGRWGLGGGGFSFQRSVALMICAAEAAMSGRKGGGPLESS